jgi:hypothetical protein
VPSVPAPKSLEKPVTVSVFTVGGLSKVDTGFKRLINSAAVSIRPHAL